MAWNGGQWVGPYDLGGSIEDKPAIGLIGGQPTAFARAADQRVWVRRFTGSFWVNWCDSGVDKSFTIAGAPTATALSSTEVDLFARSSVDGKLYWKYRKP
jgi:hypothetical protein